MPVPDVPKSDIIYVADENGVVKFSMPKEKAEKFVKKGKGEWVSPNLIQTLVRLRAPRWAMRTDDIVFTDHFGDGKNWKAGVVERERIFEQNSKNVLKYFLKRRVIVHEKTVNHADAGCNGGNDGRDPSLCL